jgi:hypothetical protein
MLACAKSSERASAYSCLPHRGGDSVENLGATKPLCIESLNLLQTLQDRRCRNRRLLTPVLILKLPTPIEYLGKLRYDGNAIE